MRGFRPAGPAMQRWRPRVRGFRLTPRHLVWFVTLALALYLLSRALQER